MSNNNVNNRPATDFLGNELEVGDEVVALEVGYRNLRKCEVVKITSVKVKLEDGNYEFYQFQSQVVKIKCEEVWCA